MDLTGQKRSWIKPWRPFRLGTTSFIFPGHILPNVKQLGRFFDEIELLIFESHPLEVLPTREEVRELKSLSRDLNVSYNIHLPVDVSLTDANRNRRSQGIDTLVRVMELLSLLNPTTHTLHLEMDAGLAAPGCGPGQLQAWRDRVDESLGIFCSRIPDPGRISIETLDYPVEYLDGLINAHGLTLCIDAGHMIRHRFSIARLFEQYGDRIPIIHLHGVDWSSTPPRDHQGLDKTPGHELRETLAVLDRFTGVVSLEVFNALNLDASLKCLEQTWSLFDSGSPPIL